MPDRGRSKTAVRLRGLYPPIMYPRVMLGAAVVTLLVAVLPARAQHPLLIVKESKYPELRARADHWPWSAMKANVRQDIVKLRYDPEEKDFITSMSQMTEVAEAAALAYILWPAAPDRAYVVDKLYQTFANFWDDTYERYPPSKDWYWGVGIARPFFASLLAFDIIYNDGALDGSGQGEMTKRETIESKLQPYAESHLNYTAHHQISTYGVRALWHLFQGNEAAAHQAVDDYRHKPNGLEDLINENGIHIGGPGYGQARFGWGRYSKNLVMDVLEHTGMGSFYLDGRVRKLHEWLYGYAVTPFKHGYVFGDSGTSLTQMHHFPGIARAHKLGKRAQGYAAWLLEGAQGPPPARLLWYVLMEEDIFQWQVRRPQSKIFDGGDDDGGGWLIEHGAPASRFGESLAGVLWNHGRLNLSGHAHKDVNAVHLCGYGEHLLLNSGYNGWGNGWGDFGWEYIRETALSSNVVLIDGQDHERKHGNGIGEGLVGPVVDYVSGDSGASAPRKALPNGRHQRSLLLVHPRDGHSGYFVLFDEVTADGGGSHMASVFLHPNSDLDPQVVHPQQEYRWTVSPYPLREGHPVHLTIFLATPPTATSIADGLLANWSESLVGRYLRSDYASDAAGKKQIVTVLFPSDAEHDKKAMARISGEGLTGAAVTLGNGLQDVMLESSGEVETAHGNVTVQASAAWWRSSADRVEDFFVRRGIRFDGGPRWPVGFSSDRAVSLQMGSLRGKVRCAETTKVKLYHPEIRAVELDGEPATPTDRGDGWVEVAIARGTHSVALLTLCGADGGCGSLDGGADAGLDGGSDAESRTDGGIRQDAGLPWDATTPAHGTEAGCGCAIREETHARDIGLLLLLALGLLGYRSAGLGRTPGRAIWHANRRENRT